MVNVRPASLADSKFVWSVRNHISSRVWLGGNEIKLKDHLKWIEEQFTNAFSYYFIGEFECNPVAYLRFSMTEGKYPVISYGVTPAQRGLGYGTLILNRGTESFFNSNVNVWLVSARVDNSNIPSVSAFRSAGFTETNDGKYLKFSLTRWQSNEILAGKFSS